MNLWKLRLSMLGTLALIIGASTLGFTLLLAYTGSLNIYTLTAFTLIFNIGQWLLSPYLVNAVYKVRELEEPDNPMLYARVERLSKRSGIDVPKVMLSQLSIPNAFAYGSPITGNHIALTKGLMEHLDPDEVEAVIGHELGHLKHRDSQIMMMVSFLPSLFYILARSLLYSRFYRGRDREGSSGLAIVGGISMLFYLLLSVFNLGLSRLREYYADQHSASILGDGGLKLSSALAKISTYTWRMQSSGASPLNSSFKALFITDPDRAERDVSDLHAARYREEELVENILGREITLLDRLTELFSTHPNIVKRLRALRGSS
ncbi:MAG: zinc metalloprotease HtpX [Candidatus Bathyarchaeia archaeon]